jgi:putative ABC transport system substrate-binding protein
MDALVVASGAVASIGYDYYDLGRQAGLLALRILRGESPAAIPIQDADATQLIINREAAERMGIALPQAVIDRALEVIE